MLVSALLALSLPFKGAGAWQSLTIYQRSGSASLDLAIAYLQNYLKALFTQFGILPIVVIVLAGAIYQLRMRRLKPLKSPNAIYLAWIAAVFVVLLLTWQLSNRYLFFAFPALMALGYAILFYFASFDPFSSLRVRYLPVIIAVFYSLLHLNPQTSFLRGPSQAAEHIVTGSPQRILYCGETDGNFIFAVRRLDPRLQTVIVRGEKLPPSIYETAKFEEMAHLYGFHHVVLERTAHHGSWASLQTINAWNELRLSPSPSMVLERVIPLASSRQSFNGELYVYRFTNPSANPQSIIKLPINLIGGEVDLNLEP
jgi:hypothetical protein